MSNNKPYGLSSTKCDATFKNVLRGAQESVSLFPLFKEQI